MASNCQFVIDPNPDHMSHVSCLPYTFLTTIEYYFGTGGNSVQTIFSINKKRDIDRYYNEVIPQYNYNIDIPPRLKHR